MFKKLKRLAMRGPVTIRKMNERVEVLRYELVLPAGWVAPCDEERPDLKKAWRDKDFVIDFDESIVVCEQCVNRMRKALELVEGQHPLDTKAVNYYADYGD